MTLVVGINLGDGVGVFGDTRGVSVSPDGCILNWADDYQKVYHMPPFIVGVSGDPISATAIIREYGKSVVTTFDKNQLLDRSCNPDWISETLQDTYNRLVRSGRISGTACFCLVFAALDYRRINVERHGSNHSTGKQLDGEIMTLDAMSQRLSRARSSNDQTGVVIALTFPALTVHAANPGEVVKTGSGSYIDSVLVQDTGIMLPGTASASPSARFSMLAFAFSRFHSTADDPTFNAAAHGVVFQEEQSICKGTAFSIPRHLPQSEFRASRWSRISSKELRSEILLLAKNKKRRWFETYFDGIHWWLLDYSEKRRCELQNIFAITAEEFVLRLKNETCKE